ncbi:MULTISPECIES: glycosyltransferase [unclassified Kribbella]|uniref:glycosyltransferase n=1 Tax=unclassified Kribbella TaxID=2644121 RepID=UPI0030178CCB
MSGRVIYAVKEPEAPGGGLRVIARHVELLLDAGIEAAIWCRTPGYRIPWFANSLPMVSGDHLDLTAEDLLVVPELYLLPGVDPAPGARKVIFNQNHFLTFWSWRDTEGYPGWDPEPHVWAVSRESMDVLARVHLHLPLSHIPNPVDGELFRPGPRDVRRIAWMPRRRPLEATIVERILRNDPRTKDVELLSLSGLSEEQVADALGQTSVFIALGISEGFGLPVAEALSAGCLVVGYPAGGGVELFEAPGAWAIPDARPHLLADRALALADVPADDPLRLAAREWIGARYNADITRQALVAAVTAARTQPGEATTATHPTVWPDNPHGPSAERAHPWTPHESAVTRRPGV